MSTELKKEGESEVKIPPGIAVRIRKVLETGQYRGMADFVRDAIRRRLEELDRTGNVS